MWWQLRLCSVNCWQSLDKYSDDTRKDDTYEDSLEGHESPMEDNMNQSYSWFLCSTLSTNYITTQYGLWALRRKFALHLHNNWNATVDWDLINWPARYFIDQSENTGVCVTQNFELINTSGDGVRQRRTRCQQGHRAHSVCTWELYGISSDVDT